MLAVPVARDCALPARQNRERMRVGNSQAFDPGRRSRRMNRAGPPPVSLSTAS